MSTKKPNMKNRSQVYNPLIDRYIKRDTTTGQFMKVKKSEGKFTRVVKPHKPKAKPT